MRTINDMGMKLMILGNDEPYNNEFKKDESKNAKEMKKISKDAQDQDNDDHGGEDINEFSMDQLLVKGNWMITMAQIGAPF